MPTVPQLRSEVQAHRDAFQAARREAVRARRGYVRDHARALEGLEDWRHALEQQERALTALAEALVRGRK